MIICPNCGKELEDETRFCDECGTQIIETIFCHHCGQKTDTEYDFCQYCGGSLLVDMFEPAVEEPVAPKKRIFAGMIDKLKKMFVKIPKRLLMIGTGAVAALLVLVVVLSIALSNSKKNDYVLYVKDKEMFFTQAAKLGPWQITDDLVASDDVGNQDIAADASTLGRYIHLSKDGKRIFYVDKVGPDGLSLYYRSATNSGKLAEKVDTEVLDYQVAENGKTIVYTKGVDKDLYIHNLKVKEKIATGVTGFAISDDAKTIIWMNQENNLYIKRGKNDNEKLDSEIDNIDLISKDFKTVWYTKDNAFYKLVVGEEKEKLASNVHSVLVAYESDAFYYLKSSETQISLYDYVDDDLADSDAAMEQPMPPQTSQEYEAYEKAQEEWTAKKNRDSIRENLKSNKNSVIAYALYYSDGKESKELTTNYVFGSAKYNTDHQVVVYGEIQKSSLGKIKMSEVTSYEEIFQKVSAVVPTISEYCIALEDNVITINQTAAEGFWIAADGKSVYFLDNVVRKTDESGNERVPHGELYKMTISGKKVKKTALYDSDVYYSDIAMHTEGKESKLFYYKSYKNGKGELFMEKEKVGNDVNSYSYDIKNNVVTCMTDWNTEKSCGTLRQWRRDKVTKIADDVNDYELTPNGQVLYMLDYSSEHYKGDLYIYSNGKKTQKVDIDVVAIIPTGASKETFKQMNLLVE